VVQLQTPPREEEEVRKEGRKEEERMGSSEGGTRDWKSYFSIEKKEGWCLEEEKGGSALLCSALLSWPNSCFQFRRRRTNMRHVSSSSGGRREKDGWIGVGLGDLSEERGM